MEPAAVTTVPGGVQTLPANDPVAALLHPQSATLDRGGEHDKGLIALYTQAVANGTPPGEAASTLLARFQPDKRMKAATVLARHMAALARDPAKAAEAEAIRGAITAALQPSADPRPETPASTDRRPARTDRRSATRGVNRPQPGQQQPQEAQRDQQQQQSGGLFGAIGSFFGGIFKAIGDFFARLFGGGRQPQQTERGDQQPVRGNRPQPQ